MNRLFIIILLFTAHIASAQETFEQLESVYTGLVSYNSASQTVTFETSGAINFTNKATNWGDPYSGKTMYAANWIWNVPTTIKNIVIKADVTVDGGFHTKGDINIVGENRKTSVMFGTPLQYWADRNNSAKKDLDEWYYCQIQAYGGTCYINNLTILNARAFAVRGWGPQVHMKKVDVIDNRGGWGNHSDGFEGGDNSTIDSCYFETGDDVIKVYFMNLKVTNTEIKMVQNSVPIQFGWGNYNNGASATFENCKIWGSSGRGSDVRIIDNAGSTQRNKTVVMNNCTIENTNGTLFRSAVTVSSPYSINVTINNSLINVKSYEVSGYNANGTRTICGTTEKKTSYDCREFTSIDIHQTEGQQSICASTINTTLNVSNITPKSQIIITDISGKIFFRGISKSAVTEIDMSNAKSGLYILSAVSNNSTITKRFLKK